MSNHSEIEKAIRTFHEKVSEVEQVLDTLNKSLMMAPESPLHSAVGGLVEGWKDTLGAAYGIGGWLEWWWQECRLGAHPMQAGLAGEELRLIATVDDLVKLVIDIQN